MEQDFEIKHWDNGACPKVDCRKKSCKCGLEKVFLSAALGDDSKDSPIAPKNGAYCNAIVVYEANDHIYIYSKEGIPTLVETGNDFEEIIEQLEDQLAQEILDRQTADNTLQGEIDDLKNSPDVVDIVATYAALQAYDTSHLGDNDIVRVLQDEQHDGQSTYYRWDKHNSAWVYIGAVGDYYTKGQVDTLLADKQNTLTAGANVAITQVDDDLVISATDTTYSAFVGTDGVDPGTAGLVPAPATTDVDKFLKADGTWGTVQAGPTVVQTTGTSTTDVMSQNATTSMVFADPGTNKQIRIGNTNNMGTDAIDIGYGGAAPGKSAIQIGRGNAGGQYSIGIGSANISALESIGIGRSTSTSQSRSVALGSYASATRVGEVNVGTGSQTYGYNSTSYRVIGGVHDGVDAHDAATVAQAVGTTETFTKATSDWVALAASSPYTYSTTVTLATTLSANSEVELINDQLVAFANYGFGILSISGQVATIASIGQPNSSITFKIKVRG